MKRLLLVAFVIAGITAVGCSSSDYVGNPKLNESVKIEEKDHPGMGKLIRGEKDWILAMPIGMWVYNKPKGAQTLLDTVIMAKGMQNKIVYLGSPPLRAICTMSTSASWWLSYRSWSAATYKGSSTYGGNWKFGGSLLTSLKEVKLLTQNPQLVKLLKGNSFRFFSYAYIRGTKFAFVLPAWSIAGGIFDLKTMEVARAFKMKKMVLGGKLAKLAIATKLGKDMIDLWTGAYLKPAEAKKEEGKKEEKKEEKK